MSRGPGRIECIVEATMREADRSFTVEELARLAYPEIAEVGKKHRVAILRALANVEKRTPLWWFKTYTPPWRVIVTNTNSVRSFAHGLMRCSWLNAKRSLDEIENNLNDPEIKSVMEPGGFWWADVEINKAEVKYNSFLKSLEAKGLAHRDGGCWSHAKSDEPAEMQDLGRQLSALRCYRSCLERDASLFVLLGKFEPPGTPVFQYAMKTRAEAVVI